MIEAQEMDTTLVTGPWQLPKGWKWVQMRNLVRLDTRTINPSDTPETMFLYLGLENIGKGQWDAVPYRTLMGKEIKSSCILFGTEHILYAKLRPYLNKVVIPSQPGIGSTEWLTLHPDTAQVDRKYLAWFLRNAAFVANMTNSVAGTRMPRIQMGTFWASPIPIPFPRDPSLSLDIQHRVVDRIESLLTDLREAQNTLESMRKDVDKVLDSVLKEIFEDLFNSTSDWNEQNVEDLCYDPQYGYTQSATLEPIGPKFLRITDIQNSRVDWNSVPYCQIPESRISTYLLQKGDILFARSGATTGKTFLVDECPTAVFASYLIRLRIKEKVLPELLAWFFKSRVYWYQIQLGGSAQPNMNAQLLKKVKVRYPQSFQVQQQIINYLGSIQEGVNGLQDMMEEDEEILQILEQGILNQAFRGEL